MNIFKKIGISTKMFFWRISAGLVRAEEDILKPKDLIQTNERNKHQIKAPIRNKTLAKMDQGVRDEKFMQDYYEVLKKGDEFLEKADPEKIAEVSGKHGMNLGRKINGRGLPIQNKIDDDGNVIMDNMGIPVQKDEYGRRYDHYGFFDPKHKHYGKTIREVTKAQVDERTTKDDDFPIEFMINNTPIVGGVADGISMGTMRISEQAKNFKFPIKIIRKGKHNNKIEQITEFLHVKRIDDVHMILEFLIPKKYKLSKYGKKSKVMKELIDFQQVWHIAKYGERYGFNITSFYKKTKIDRYDVIKFNANLIEHIK